MSTDRWYIRMGESRQRGPYVKTYAGGSVTTTKRRSGALWWTDRDLVGRLVSAIGPCRAVRVQVKGSPEPLEGPPVNGSVEDEGCHMRWVTLANALGFNLLAKDHAKDLESKAYFRLFRDSSVKQLIDLGGNGGMSPFAEEDSILELEVPDVMPRLQFRAADIELMRLVVAKHDVAAAGSRAGEK